METLQEKINRVIKEPFAIMPYDPGWPAMFEKEKLHLLTCLPAGLIRRIEHFGSTAVPGLAAKPIIDMLVEVTSLEETKRKITPVLEEQGYDYFWRPSFGDSEPPFYAWFIKRDLEGNRTHHIHMVEREFECWDRLFFRDYLIEHPETAKEYQDLKTGLAEKYSDNRLAYTTEKKDFIVNITQIAKEYYKHI